VRLLLPIPAVLLFALPLGADDPKKKVDGSTYQVPYRLTDTKHVLVRAKINGKGPYNFIVDTGAPALFVATAVGKKLGIEPDDKGWGSFDRFELEGGVVVEKAKAKIADPFQLEGMNKLGLAGVELHGVIGYTILARFRIGFDFSKDKLTWTALDFEPPQPRGVGGNDAGVDALGGLVKVMTTLLGKQLERETRFRGALGVELAENDPGVVARVLPGSPAAEAKFQVGDAIVAINSKPVTKPGDVQRLLAPYSAGTQVELTIRRGDDRKSVIVTLGKGI
jgi:hypothetical protein